MVEREECKGVGGEEAARVAPTEEAGVEGGDRGICKL